MKRVTAIIIVLGLVIALSSALSAGTADDPLISLSYINNTFLPSLIEEVKSSAATALATVADEAEQKLSEVTNGYILTAPGYSFTSGYFSCPAVAGAVLELAPGSSAVLVNGTAKLTIKSGDVVDLQTGSLLSSGNILSGNSRIFATEEASASLTVYSNTAELYVDGSYRFSQGNGVAPGVVFNDIPNDHWALEYIYVLAEQKLVNGTGNLRFEPETTMNRAMFVTVIGRLADVDTCLLYTI